jgi:hypothetical protein
MEKKDMSFFGEFGASSTGVSQRSISHHHLGGVSSTGVSRSIITSSTGVSQYHIIISEEHHRQEYIISAIGERIINDRSTSVNRSIIDRTRLACQEESQQVRSYFHRRRQQIKRRMQVSFQETAVHQEEQEPAQEQGAMVPEDQNVFQEAPDEEQSDIALVENAYLYLTKGAYPDGATKNEKRSIRRKAERLKEVNGELYYKKRGGAEVSECV